MSWFGRKNIFWLFKTNCARQTFMCHDLAKIYILVIIDEPDQGESIPWNFSELTLKRKINTTMATPHNIVKIPQEIIRSKSNAENSLSGSVGAQRVSEWFNKRKRTEGHHPHWFYYLYLWIIPCQWKDNLGHCRCAELLALNAGRIWGNFLPGRLLVSSRPPVVWQIGELRLVAAGENILRRTTLNATVH